MNKKEIKIAIAGAMGYIAHATIKGAYTHPKYKGIFGSPNYPEDLNACAKFEQTLNHDELLRYLQTLHIICKDADPVRGWPELANPAQKCEAFLRVKGLWRD